jgi:ferrous iron transport protein B
LFYSIFSLAAPVMDWTQQAVTWLGGLVTNRLPEGAIRDLWSDGIVAGVGGVVVFVP